MFLQLVTGSAVVTSTVYSKMSMQLYIGLPYLNYTHAGTVYKDWDKCETEKDQREVKNPCNI